MKKVLSLLVAFVFLQVNTWALSGGPDYSKLGQGVNDLIGTYAGVLIPTGTTNLNVNTGAEALGLFSVTIPGAGLATGQAIVFIRGTAFQGNVVAFGDPDKGTLKGVFAGTSNFDVVIPGYTQTLPNGSTITVEDQTFKVFAQGKIDAEIKKGLADAFQGGTGGTTSTITAVTTTEVGNNFAARVVGTAEIDTFFQIANDGTPIINETTSFNIDGIKQSNTSSTTTSTGIFFFF